MNSNPSPVAQALARERMAEQARAQQTLANNESQLAANVISALGYQPYHPGNAWEPFAAWCKQVGVNFFPAKPSTVAAYILHLHQFGKSFDDILEQLSGIADIHDISAGNPVTTGIVNAALTSIAEPGMVTPPHSWKKEEQAVFWHLPAVIQSVIKRRDKERERHLHNKTAECGELRRKVRDYEIQNTAKSRNGRATKDAGDSGTGGDAQKTATSGDVVTIERPGGIDGAGRPAPRRSRKNKQRANA